jgi:hypothetical protein
MIRKFAYLAAALSSLQFGMPSVSYGSSASSAVFRDNEDGDEGDGVVDPVPQDDGSDGVDDGSGDGS